MVYFGLFKVFLGEKFKIGPEYDKIKVAGLTKTTRQRGVKLS